MSGLVALQCTGNYECRVTFSAVGMRLSMEVAFDYSVVAYRHESNENYAI
jgi:hypothetical protein